MSKPILLKKSFLLKEYINKRLSSVDIAKSLECSSTTVQNYLKFYDIKTRNPLESQLDKQVGKNNSMFGKHRKGKKAGNYKHGLCCKDKHYYCKDCGKEISQTGYIYKHVRKCWICANYKRMKSIHKTPNKCEQKLDYLLFSCLNDKYKFVGDGNFFVDCFNPDFINIKGQKKIIELYGNYWHELPKAKKRNIKRIKTYKKYGYKTLVIWSEELKDLEQVIAKIMEFDL